MLEASEVPDLRDEADGRHKRDAAQRLQRLHDRRPAPRGRELPELRLIACRWTDETNGREVSRGFR